MNKLKKKRKIMKGLISLLLVFAVMVSITVPFDIISVLAAEEPARGDEICALLYYIDPNKLDSTGNIVVKSNLELVFQRGDTVDTDRTDAYIKTYRNFADIGSSESPWRTDGYKVIDTSIYKVDIRDKIAPTRMDNWFYDQRNLVEIKHIENIDTSQCTSFAGTFNYSYGIRELDLTCWDTSNITSVSGMFSHQGNQYDRGLKKLNISNWTLPKCSNYNTFIYESQIVDLDMSAMCSQVSVSYTQMLMNNHKLKTVKIGHMSTGNASEPYYTSLFANCENLESVYSEGEPVYGKVDLSAWTSKNMRRFNSMFKNCAKIKEVDFGENIISSYRNYSNCYSSMFEGCTSLETFKFNFGRGALVADAPTFKGCSNLQELDFSKLETTTYSDRFTSNISNSTNIYEDCDSLYKVTFNANYPQAGMSGTSVPPKATWLRKKNADGSDYTGEKQVLSASELFLDFKPAYAGTWIAVDKIVLNANGGSPARQTIDGGKESELQYDPSEIIAPERNGFDFDDWYSEKENGKGVKLENGAIAQSWTYYAHWNEHHYTLKLNGNGGKNSNNDDEFVADDSLNYTEFFELSNTMFTRDGYVLSSWNTRPNGTGDSYAANDSVRKLTEAQGATVTLYAQWHKPDVVISFNSHGGSAVSDKNYTLATGTIVNYGDLSESFREADAESENGYTFLGWFTEAEGGDKITSSTQVTESCTLHAHWAKNPGATFDANGGYFDNDSTKTSTTKICKYDSKLGVLPEPEHASASFDGWYTAASGGGVVSSDTKITSNTTYYAHWGYAPKFETNGGSFVTYPSSGYSKQSTSSYLITELPTVSKDNADFEYWEFNGQNLNEALANSENNPKSITLDLSSGNIVNAIWDNKAKYTLTLDHNNGTSAKSIIKVYADQTIGGFPTVTRNGYDFEGWFPNADGTGTELKASDTVSSDATYYAKWKQRTCTLTFDPDGGIMYDTSTVKVASGKTVPQIPGANRAGYYLEGWYTEKNGGGTKLLATSTVSSSAPYYANWVAKEQSTDIYNYSIVWSQNSDSTVTNLGDKLVFHPIIGDEISAQLLISFAIDSYKSSSKILPAGAVQITFPISMFEENGVALDRNNIDRVNTDNYSYEVVGDNYVFTNKNELRAGDKIDFTYSCTVSPRDIKGGYTDGNGYWQGNYYQASFTPSITVTDNTNPLSYSRPLSLEAHTEVLTSAMKSRTSVVFDWNNDWGSRPADADEYFYVNWELESNGDSASSQKYRFYWSEETAHDGTVVYSNPTLGTKSNLITGGKYISAVVTKHRKKDFEGQLVNVRNEALHYVEWDSGYVEHERVIASTNVYVPSESGEGCSLIKYVPDYKKSESHYKNGGQELILAGEEVVLPYIINYSETTNDNSPSWNAVTEKYKAVKRDYVLTDGVKGDSVISAVRGTTSYDWLNTDEALNDSDYYFDSLTIELGEYDAECLGDVWSNPELHSKYSDYADTEIWIRTEGDSEFKLFKTLAGFSSSTVTLPEKTVGFKLKHSSEFFTTGINVTTNLHLKSSSRVLELVRDHVGDDRATLIKNKATVTLTTTKDNAVDVTILDSSDISGWVCSYELNIGSSNIYTAKDCSNNDGNIETNTSAATETTAVMISGWGYNNSGNKKLMKSGVFYDLLPVEFSVDKSSVFVVPFTTNTASRNGNSIDADRYFGQNIRDNALPSSSFNIEFTDNWQNTGRTLMTITVIAPDDVKATGFDVFYKMTTSFVNLYTNGLNQLNFTAFEDTTEGQSIPSYKDGKLDTIDKKYRGLFEIFDGDLTAFAQAETHCLIPLTYEHGVRSVVKTEGVYKTKNETVGLNSEYSYFISYAGSSSAHTKNLIIYDVIENRIEGLTSEWNGKFDSVDTSLVKTVDSATPADGVCAPVVYYSTKPKAQFTESDFDLSKTSVWTTEMPVDKSTITAVAVDCSKTNYGKDFVLAPQKQLRININMLSPDEADKNDKVTYNESYIKAMNQELEKPINEVTRTSVTLHFTPPTFSKTAFPESGTLKNNTVEGGEVVKNSTIDYKLNISNPDDTLSVYNIVVEDTLQKNLSINNTVKVAIGNETSVAINKSARIASYSIEEVTDGADKRTKFSATIASLAPGETMTITVPATVLANNNTIIENTSYITGYNGMAFTAPNYVKSETTYHIVADIKAKIKKVNSKGEGLAGAKLQILSKDKTQVLVDDITSTTDVMKYELAPDDYVLHEVSPPSVLYKTAADIPFTLDVEGICHVNGKAVNYVEMVDEPQYKILFHENKPGGSEEELTKVFKTVQSTDDELINNSYKIEHFYDIPEWAGDEYVFAGWYYNKNSNNVATYKPYKTEYNINTYANTPANFESDSFTEANNTSYDSNGTYHLYAKWIKVGTVNKDEDDTNNAETYRGFGLEGVQVRDELLYDSNHSESEDKSTPAGMRYISSLSESLLSQIDLLSDAKVHTDDGYDVNVEYGYVASRETNIKAFTTHYDIQNPSDYPLQYKGEKVNGKDTTGKAPGVDTDFRHVLNVNCTRGTGKIKNDHRNYIDYRLFTFVITYEGNGEHSKEEAESMKADKVCARAYIRYYDANGKLRVFYNTYKKSMYSGCLCSYNQAIAALS